MNLDKKQIDFLNRREIVVLASASSVSEPRAILVEVNKAEENKLIITDNEMEITRKNILENKKVFVLAFEEDYSYGLKIEGEAEYYTKGEFFDFVKNLETNKKFSPKAAIVVDVRAVSEFK